MDSSENASLREKIDLIDSDIITVKVSQEFDGCWWKEGDVEMIKLTTLIEVVNCWKRVSIPLKIFVRSEIYWLATSKIQWLICHSECQNTNYKKHKVCLLIYTISVAAAWCYGCGWAFLLLLLYCKRLRLFFAAVRSNTLISCKLAKRNL